MLLLYVYTCLQLIFESLPVSSSTQVALGMRLIQSFIPGDMSFKTLPAFDFLLHIPTVCIVTLFLYQEARSYLKDHWNKRKLLILKGVALIRYALIADSVTVLFYFFWDLVSVTFFPLWLGCLITTLLLWSLRFYKKEKIKKQEKITDAFIIGAVQGLSLLPGISRLGSTFVVGVWRGLSWQRSFMLSLWIHLPLMGVAGLKALWFMFTVPAYREILTISFGTVVLGASVVSFCVLYAVFSMVKQKTLWKLSWYTGAVTIVAFVWLLKG